MMHDCAFTRFSGIKWVWGRRTLMPALLLFYPLPSIHFSWRVPKVNHFPFTAVYLCLLHPPHPLQYQYPSRQWRSSSSDPSSLLFMALLYFPICCLSCPCLSAGGHADNNPDMQVVYMVHWASHVHRCSVHQAEFMSVRAPTGGAGSRTPAGSDNNTIIYFHTDVHTQLWGLFYFVFSLNLKQ